jgi:uncharacterized membrane protein
MRTTTIKLTSRFFIATLFLLWTVSCDNHDLGPVVIVDCSGVAAISYQLGVKPVVDRVCSECHNSSWPEGDWTSAVKIKEHAAEAARRVQLPTTDPDHMPKNGVQLTEQELEAIVCWAAQGAPI